MQTGLRALQGSVPGTAMGTSPRKAGLGAVPEILLHAGIAKLQILQGLLGSQQDTAWEWEEEGMSPQALDPGRTKRLLVTWCWRRCLQINILHPKNWIIETWNGLSWKGPSKPLGPPLCHG